MLLLQDEAAVLIGDLEARALAISRSVRISVTARKHYTVLVFK